MITSIVRKVQQMLRDSGRKDVEVEIVFPVSSQAITTSGQVGDMKTCRWTFDILKASPILAEVTLSTAQRHGSVSTPSCFALGQIGAAMSTHCLAC